MRQVSLKAADEFEENGNHYLARKLRYENGYKSPESLELERFIKELRNRRKDDDYEQNISCTSV